MLITLIDILFFAFTAVSVIYVAVFAFASLLRDGKARPVCEQSTMPRFLILVPAYAEDTVIQSTIAALSQQTYPISHHQTVVISDHMQTSTDAALRRQGATVVVADYADSSKAKALRLAMSASPDVQPDQFDFVVILDADNLVEPDFLQRLASHCSPDTVALQLHRCAKNTQTAVAVLDAVSEEVNNSIFRLGHNCLGLSSALIGSGMCLRRSWFADAVGHLQTAGEDKELERLLLLQGHHIHYIPDINVYDEKVSTRNNFGQQRRRWLAAQLWALGQMVRQLPSAMRHGRIDFIDKTLQQALIPRSLLIALLAVFTLAATLLDLFTGSTLCPKWWMLSALFTLALMAAIPRQMYGRRLLSAVLTLPALIGQMFQSLLHTKGASHNYIHTQHGA